MSSDNLTLGQKIEYYRKRAKMSQLELELEIDASQGSISRIENGQVNPTKETIIAIAKALKLTDEQIASLFSLNISSSSRLVDLITLFNNADDSSSVIEEALNKIAEYLDYVNVSVYLLKGDTYYALYINSNDLVNRALKLLPVKFNQLTLKVTSDSRNFLLRAALDNKPYESNDLADFARDVFSPTLASAMQKITKMHTGIAVPVSYNGTSIGAMLFTKENTDNYSSELPILEAFARQIAVVLIFEGMQKGIKVYGQ